MASTSQPRKATKKRRDQINEASKRWREKQTERGKKKIAGVISLESASILERLRESQSKTNGDLLDEAVRLLDMAGATETDLLTSGAAKYLSLLEQETQKDRKWILDDLIKAEYIRIMEEREEEPEYDEDIDF